MDNLARKHDNLSVFHELGTITNIQKDTYTVTTVSGTYTAHKAVSCLLVPTDGAKVLMLGDPEGKCYILAVLEHGIEQKSSIRLDGDSEIVAQNGRLQIAAQEGIDLVSANDIGLMAPDLTVHSQRAEISIPQLFYAGTKMLAKISTIKIIASSLESTVRRVRQQLTSSFRSVEEMDQVKAGKIDYTAEKVMSLRGKYSLVTAKEDVKIDGKMIHMG